MWIIAIAWMFVVVLMSVAEAVNPQGTVLGAIVTFLLYGLGPMSLVMYILATPMRRRARQAAEAAEMAAQSDASSNASTLVLQPDASGLPPRDAVTAEGKEPGGL